MSSILIYQNQNIEEVQAQDGENLLELLRRSGFQVTAPCGGNGTCGKCLVKIWKNGREDTVLACQTKVDGDITVFLNEAAEGGDICAEAVGAAAAETSFREGLGAAVDIGTTTVVVKLFSLSDGRELGTASAWNAQAGYGADVISRTQYTMEHEDGLELLSGLIRNQILQLLHGLCDKNNIEYTQVKEICIAGNTIMQHLFAGLSPRSIAVSPFKPLSLFEDGEESFEGMTLSYAPCVAGYVGGDIVAGLLSSGIADREGKSLFLDIGTNGEMALGGKDGFVSCSVASGPAFEGAGVSCGMASTEGAISHVSWNGEEFVCQVIGDGKPKGLCGSGLIDLLAVLVENGVVDESGCLLSPDEAPEEFLDFMGEDENGNGIVFLTDDDSVYFTANDVRQLQLAKAAVAAGISVMMKSLSLDFEDISALYIAGGFGYHMDAESAMTIGMLPTAMRGKSFCVGNSSLAGMQMALLDLNAREKMREIQKKCGYLELSGNAAFNAAFPEHMTFDEEDVSWN